MTVASRTTTPLVPAHGHPRRAVVVAIVGLVAIAVLALTWALIAWYAGRFEPPPVRFIRGPAVILTEAFLIVAYATLGGLLARSEPRNPLGWLLIAIGLSTSLQLPVSFLVRDALQALRPVPEPIHLAAWLASSFQLPLMAAFTVLVILLFPDGRAPGPGWRFAGWSAVAGALALGLAAGLAPEGLLWYPSLANPFAAPASWEPALAIVTYAGLAAVLGGLFGAAASMVVRYRGAPPVIQLQLRWIAYAVVSAAAVGAPFLVVRYALSMPDAAGEWFLVAMVAGASLLPISAGFAILKHDLFDIDRFIHRTLVYVPLTALLAGLWAALLTIVNRVMIAMTGDTSDIAVIVTALVLAALATPTKGWLDRFVDRHVKPVAVLPPLPPERDPVARRALVAVESGVAFEVEALHRRVEVLERQLAEAREASAARSRSPRRSGAARRSKPAS